MLNKEVRVDGVRIGTIVHGTGFMLESLQALQDVGPERAAKAISEAMADIEVETILIGTGTINGQGLIRLIEDDIRHRVCMMEMFPHDIHDADPRPLVARIEAPQYLSPQMLRMDANSRKYQSTQKNWRKFDGQHHKKKKIIK